MEIEKYVEEIMRASKDDVMDIQVDMGEFYLADLVKKIFYLPGKMRSAYD